MKKALRIAGISAAVIACLPIAFLALWIVWEVFCACVNGISGHLHTESVLNGYSNTNDITVLDKSTFVGNTSGTGNHTEVRTTVLVKANDIKTVEYWTYGDFYHITSLSEEKTEYYGNSSRRSREISDFEREIDIPTDVTNCYVVEVYGSVPFPDSIVGH